MLENLNPQQKEAVLNFRGPMMILAGAGTGNVPCALLSVPCPMATLAHDTVAGRSQSSAAAVPTTSTIESIAPTSWNRTSSIVEP